MAGEPGRRRSHERHSADAFNRSTQSLRLQLGPASTAEQPRALAPAAQSGENCPAPSSRWACTR